MAPMTNADKSPTNRLTLFPIYLSLFVVSTLWPRRPRLTSYSSFPFHHLCLHIMYSSFHFRQIKSSLVNPTLRGTSQGNRYFNKEIINNFPCGIAWFMHSKCCEASKQRNKNSSQKSNDFPSRWMTLSARETIWQSFDKIITVKHEPTRGNLNFSCRIV